MTTGGLPRFRWWLGAKNLYICVVKTTLSYTLVLAIGTLVFSSCRKDTIRPQSSYDGELTSALYVASGGAGPSYYMMPSSTNYAAIPQDPTNPITAEKVALGQLLFHETGLAQSPKLGAGMGAYSCASCHHAGAGFQAGIAQGLGEGGSGYGIAGEGRVPDPAYPTDSIDLQPLRSPAALNTAYQQVMLWNGQFGAVGLNANTQSSWTVGTPIETNFLGYEGVETQAIAGLKVHRMVVDSALVAQLGYQQMFDDAFPTVPVADRYTREYAGLAIAAYERTILASESPFQRWLNGDLSAMSDLEKQGAIAFFGEAQCYTCHNGPALNSEGFHAIGMGDLSGGNVIIQNASDYNNANTGRGFFTQHSDDMYCFKVPQLYNLEDSKHFGHGASFNEIRDVVAYKNAGVAQNASVPLADLDPTFIPLNLSEETIDAITAFISSALYDPALSRYVPQNLPSGNCFPNGDAQSMTDLGCN